MLDIKNIYHKIILVLRDNNLEIDFDLANLIEKRLKINENNIYFFANSSVNKKKYFMKYFLKKQNKHDLVRKILNLKNEIRFYRQVRKYNKSVLQLPILCKSNTRGHPWIILEKLSDKISFFPKDIFFSENSFSEKDIPIIINGLKEFQKIKLSVRHTHEMNFSDIKSWLQNLQNGFTGKIIKFQKPVLQKINNFETIWNENLTSTSHCDLVEDAFAIDYKNNRLTLLDFEKVQISHPAFDFVSFTINPLVENWNKKFEQQLFNSYQGISHFQELYFVSSMIRKIFYLNNFKTGRYDHIYENILSTSKYQKLKPKFIELWENKLIENFEAIK